jgi:general secretion pathway protein K
MIGRQRGVALITVLLVVAIVTVVSAGMITRQQLAIRATANQAQVRQAWHYALGGEALAQGILARDLQASRSAVDHLQEAWAQALPTFAIEQGEIKVRIEDLSGRFNLNSLVSRQSAPESGAADPLSAAGTEVNLQALAQFRRLLSNLGIPPNAYPEQLVDWLDTPPERFTADGAEDLDYLLAQPAYRAANRRIEEVSELRLLLSMQEADYRRLLPYVSALPADTALNINTASAMLLSSLRDNLSPAAAQQLVQERPAAGYTELSVFIEKLNALAPDDSLAPSNLNQQNGLNQQRNLNQQNTPADQNRPASADDSAGQPNLALGSEYFQVTSEVRLAQRWQVLVSTLQRPAAAAGDADAAPAGGGDVVRVLQRNLGQSVRVAPAVPVENEE